VSRLNGARMRANVIEAAEQCGILGLASVAEPQPLSRYLADRDRRRLLVFCDEAAGEHDPIGSLRGAPAHDGVDVLVGPEGGFVESEREAVLAQPSVVRLSLGPRILRADTAGVAALALVEAAFRPA
jgi:16S rRNA (uracil1498-N3)-methyltransferase